MHMHNVCVCSREVGWGGRWEEKGKAENEVVGWYHRLNGHEFE